MVKSFQMAHNLTLPDDAYIPPELIGLHRVTPEQFEQLCQDYSELRLELTSTGELIVMPGSGFETGRRNSYLNSQLETWARADGSGAACDSSTVFVLPNGARRMPDASWVKRESWDHLSAQQRERFGPFCPDFVIELRSPTDRITNLRDKMVEYMENGTSLGWLIDPYERRVYIYEPDHELLILENPETVHGDPLLPGFELNLTEIWSVE
jgi:Uma2 family endonuclease